MEIPDSAVPGFEPSVYLLRFSGTLSSDVSRAITGSASHN